MPRVAADQARSGPAVPVSQLEPGDLLFYHTDPTAPDYISHVAIYLGNGWMIQAPAPGQDVEVVPADFGSEFAGAVRVSPALAASVAGGVASPPFVRRLAFPCTAALVPLRDRSGEPVDQHRLQCNHDYMSTEVRAWFTGRLPDDWFTEPAEVTVDREEITIMGTLPAPDADDVDAAAEGRIKRFARTPGRGGSRSRRRGRAQVRPEGRLGCDPAATSSECSPAVRPGDDQAQAVGAAGARHARRRGCRPLPVNAPAWWSG